MGAAAETDQLQCQKQTTAAEPADKEPVCLKHFVHPANASAATVIAEVKKQSLGKRKKSSFRRRKKTYTHILEEQSLCHSLSPSRAVGNRNHGCVLVLRVQPCI